MSVKTTVTVVMLMLAATAGAQDVKRIISELQAPPVSAPVQKTSSRTDVSPVVPDEVKAVPAVTAAAVEPVRSEPAQPAPAVVVAQKPASVAEENVETVAVTSEASGKGAVKDGLISLNLKEVELSSVIRLFATLSDANIIIPALENGVGAVKVDVNLKDVEWKPALQSILETQGLELYEKNPGSKVYSVRKKLADAPELMSVKTFKLNYATVLNVNEMIKGMVPEKGKISVFPARNTIIVQSTPENLVEIQNMISAVDLPRQQVFIEAKFMELTDSASEKLGIDWQVLGGYGVGIGGIGGTYNDSRTRTETISKTYGLDGTPLVDRTAKERTVDGATVTYVDAPQGAIGLPNVYGDTEVPTTTVLNKNVLTKSLGATLSADEFNLVLAALKETTGAKVVSNPKVIVANEETATIHIGKKKPNVRGTSQTAGDSQSVTTYGLDDKEPYFEDGIKVNVTPTINTASNITVKIQPTLDRLETDAQAFTAPDGTRFYGKSTKTINTLFSLGDGQTAAIGGLTQTTSDDIERKIPLLGSLPVIGRFFSYSAKTHDQVETVIFVTVGLANPEHINMATGLPEESSLTMRHNAKMKATRQIKAEELKLLEMQEAERADESLQKLQTAEQKHLKSKK